MGSPLHGLDMGASPWTVDEGLQPSQSIRKMIARKMLFSSRPIPESQIQPASVDLRLGPVAFRVRASFIPGPGSTVPGKVSRLCMGEIDLSRGAVLEKGCVYVVPLQEELALASGIAAKATPKSTAGRLGLFTRLLADHAEEFDRVPAGYAGRLYAEVVPRAFSVLVREGARLGQIRFLKGDPESPDSRLGKLHLDKTLVCGEGGVRAEARIRDGLWITIDLAGGASPSTAGYRARQNAPLIDLEKTDFYDPVDFWEALPVSPGKSLVLNPGDFHILVSRERVRVPPTHAAVMVPYEPSIGEFRVHYAGFFDPGFGYGEGDIPGTPAVLEVLSHEAPFLLEHGQIVGRLVYERLSERPERVYGPGIGSSYQFQALGLSKQFRRTAGPALTP